MNLSTVMPVLGQIEMTKTSLESLCVNTKNLWEVIVINDGDSRDKEEYNNLVLEFAKKYSSIRFAIENTGGDGRKDRRGYCWRGDGLGGG